MSYLEELLPEFRKGAKIRQSIWEVDDYILLNEAGLIVDNGGDVIYLGNDNVMSDDWEFYQKPIDWDYIIKNKCLCWFWDSDDKYKSMEKLAYIHDKADYPFENTRGGLYRHCHPVFKDEVTFYENKNNE